MAASESDTLAAVVEEAQSEAVLTEAARAVTNTELTENDDEFTKNEVLTFGGSLVAVLVLFLPVVRCCWIHGCLHKYIHVKGSRYYKVEKIVTTKAVGGHQQHIIRAR